MRGITAIVCVLAYIVVVEMAPIPQMVKLWIKKESDQMSLLFTAALAIGRLLALPYILQKEAKLMAWGLFAGAILRLALLLQSYHYQRRTELLKRLREEEVTI